MGANSVGAELAMGRNQYHSVDVCRKFCDVPVAVDVVVCLTFLSMYCLLQSLNKVQGNKSAGGSVIYNFRGNNCEWDGINVFHAAAVNRKILPRHSPEFS